MIGASNLAEGENRLKTFEIIRFDFAQRTVKTTKICFGEGVDLKLYQILINWMSKEPNFIKFYFIVPNSNKLDE